MSCTTDPRATHETMQQEGSTVDFETYTRTLEFLTTLGHPREARSADAWHAGGGRGPLPASLSPSPYLYDQLEEAFRLGQEAR